MSTPLEPRTDDGAHPAPRRQGINCNEAGELNSRARAGTNRTSQAIAPSRPLRNCPIARACLNARGRLWRTSLRRAALIAIRGQNQHSSRELRRRPSLSAPVLSVATAQYSRQHSFPGAKRGPGTGTSKTSTAVGPECDHSIASPGSIVRLQRSAHPLGARAGFRKYLRPQSL